MSTAAEYIAQGMALVHIEIGKGPTQPGWNRPKNAITTTEQAVLLTDNIGLAHAYCQPVPTMALDIDDMPRATVWLADRGIDLAGLLNAPDGVQIVSGREGRAKLLYRLPVGRPPIESITVKEKAEDGKGITVLECRCATRDGLTVQDVLPPSIHPDTGRPYSWGGLGDWRAIPEIPLALLTVWEQERAAQAARRVRPKGQLSLFKGVDDTPGQRARLAAMLHHISADCPYELYRDIVWAILSLGWHDGEELAEAWCMTAPHRFEDDDFWNVVNSHDLSRSPSIGTIRHHARKGGWNG